MTSWADGYVADIQYAAMFHGEMAPVHLAFAALVAGQSPGRAERPKAYLELACGQGFGTALLAAANPDTAFVGVDFNPAQIANARSLSERAGLSNVTFRDLSFEEILSRPEGEIGMFDVIAAHGIYSWISADNRRAVASILRRHLEPGGLAYVSYNSMPGWAATAPLQRLIREHTRRHPGRSDRQLDAALAYARRLQQDKAGYFVHNPVLQRTLGELAKKDRRYLTHEYLGAHWHPLYFADVAAELEAAKLSFLASATLSENMDQVVVPEALRPLILEAEDPVWRETIRDYATDKQFRRDIFARGPNTLTGSERKRLFSKLRFALTVARSDVTFRFATPLWEAEGQEASYGPLADLLADRSASLQEVLALPAIRDQGGLTGLEMISLLVQSGQATPLLEGGPVDCRPAQRFNRAVVEAFKEGCTYTSLAAPVAGTGIPAALSDLLALSAIYEDRASRQEDVGAHALSVLKGLGKRPMKDGQPVTDDREAEAHLALSLGPVVAGKRPMWERLGVL